MKHITYTDLIEEYRQYCLGNNPLYEKEHNEWNIEEPDLLLVDLDNLEWDNDFGDYTALEVYYE